MASVVVQFQGLSADMHSDTTFEYVVLALTVLQMFATYGYYPASSGIAVSLFALVALGINRQPFWKWCFFLSTFVIASDLVHISVIYSALGALGGGSAFWPPVAQWSFACYIMAIPLKVYVAYFSRTKHAIAVSATSSLSDGLVNQQQQQQQYAAPQNYSMPPPQQNPTFAAPAYVPPPASSNYGTEPSLGAPSVAATQASLLFTLNPLSSPPDPKFSS